MMADETEARGPVPEEDLPGPSIVLLSGRGSAWRLREERGSGEPDQAAAGGAD